MRIKDFAGFQLDVSKIELHSSHKRDILLPYFGPLPSALQDNDGAIVSVVLGVGLSVKTCLIVTIGKKQYRYPLEATAQEINDFLFPFFHQNTGCTRMDTGLSQYWLGIHQSSYIHWKRLAYEGSGICNQITQLSPASSRS